jgi:hypothetical protein
MPCANRKADPKPNPDVQRDGTASARVEAIRRREGFRRQTVQPSRVLEAVQRVLG